MISKRDDQMRRPAGRRKCQSGNKLGIERGSSKASVFEQVTYAKPPSTGSGADNLERLGEVKFGA